MEQHEFKMTDEKVSRLKPIFERILSRKYGREIKLTDLRFSKLDSKEVGI
jgi:hypothetical protein